MDTVVLSAQQIESAPVDLVRIHPMSFTLRRGELCALFGPSGSGKSLLVALLSGEVALEGGVLESADFATMPELPAQRLLRSATPASVLKRYANTWTRAIYLLELLGLGERLDTPLSMLSSGQRAMLRVCCALAQNVPLYLLDDPFEGADFERASRLWGELDDRCRFGATVLFSTRDPAIARKADRVLMLDAGHLIADGTPEQLIDGLNTTRLEVEVSDPEPLMPMLEGVELQVFERAEGYQLTLYAPDTLALRLLREGYGNVRTVLVHQPTLADAWHWFHLQARQRRAQAKPYGTY